MEAFLTEAVAYLVSQSWQIAILTVAIAAATFALRNKSAHVRYLLWLIVLAKCLVPPVHSVPLGILPVETHARQPMVAPQAEILPEQVQNADINPVLAHPPESGIIKADAAARPRGSATASDVSAKTLMLRRFGIAWIIGASIYLAMNVLRALRANFWLWKKRRILPAELQTDIQRLFSASHLKRFPRIWLIDDMSQPFVWGVLRGSIYLPVDFLKINNPINQRSVLGHEFSHILRFDAAVNLLQVLAQAIFWFHPFVWWANKKMRAEREKCCDEMAVAYLNTSPKIYSMGVLETLITQNKQTQPVPSLAVAGPVKSIEDRIKTMMRPGKKFYKRPSLIAATIVLVLAMVTVPTALILTARAKTDSAEKEKKTYEMLPHAVIAGDMAEVNRHIAEGADVNQKFGRWTALSLAVMKGHKDVAGLLIDKGADLNGRGGNNRTPLHEAILNNHTDIVRLLVAKGADIDAACDDGRNAISLTMMGTKSGHKEMADLLITKGAKVADFHLAAYRGDVEKLKKYIQDGTNVDMRNPSGGTALHIAANLGKKQAVEFLVDQGAEVDVRDKSYYTPLLYAALHNHRDIFDFLLAKGADINLTHEGMSLIHFAVEQRNKGAVNLLLDKGADVNAKIDPAHETPLFWAVWNSDKDLMRLLISRGADVTATYKGGWTALHEAVWAGDLDMAKILVESGARFDRKPTVVPHPYTRPSTTKSRRL